MLIDECGWEETTFLETTLKEVELNNVNFERAEFIHTSLADIDFSTCDIYGTQFDSFSLKGMVIDPFQAQYIVGALGVNLKD